MMSGYEPDEVGGTTGGLGASALGGLGASAACAAGGRGGLVPFDGGAGQAAVPGVTSHGDARRSCARLGSAWLG
jgi:hypothetical protein